MVNIQGATLKPENTLTVTTSGWTHYRGVTSGGASVRIEDITVTPARYSCAGNGTTDDTTNLNAMITAVRALISSERVRVKIDLNGGIYKVTGNGINMSGMRAWNLEVCNGVILGHTTGKPVIDCVGMRGATFRNILFAGDGTNTPTLPFLFARGTASGDGFCDNCLFDNVTTIGSWSVGAIYVYGQETTTHHHCRYWNYKPTASIAIFEGYDSHPQTSVNKTLVTGGVSHINNVYINCDFRYQPQPGVDRGTITGITKANPAVVTCSGGHPFANGDTVIIAHVEAGMTQINSVAAVVANATATTFEMTGVDSSAYTTYTSGGFAMRRNTQPAIYANRIKGHRFIGCYVVSYSQDSIELGFPDNQKIEECTFDFLQEGAAQRSIFRFSGVSTATQQVHDCEFKGYATHCGGAYFSSDASGAGRVVMYGPTIKVTSHIHVDLPLVVTGDEALYAFYGAKVWWYTRSKVTPLSYTAFRGEVFAVSDGYTDYWNGRYKSNSDGAFTPTVTASVGTITTVGALDCYAKYEDDFVHLNLSVTITDNGTGATVLRITLPFTPADDAVLTGSNFSTGAMLQGRVNDGTARVDCVTYNNTYPVASGQKIILSGRVRKAS